MKPVTFGKKINLWKWDFLTLLAIQLGLGLVLWQRLTHTREHPQSASYKAQESVQIGSFHLNRDQLNASLAAYLKDFQSKDFPYQVHVTTHQVLFEGTYELLGGKIPLYIYLQPLSQEDGSVHLKVLEVSAGTLALPTKDILTYVSKHYRLPDMIAIDPATSTIKVQLALWTNPLNVIIKAKTIDLYNDRIVFDLYRQNH